MVAFEKSETCARQPRSPWRWFRFGLGTMFAVLSIGCMAPGWIANRAQRQERAAAAVRHLGGAVLYAQESVLVAGMDSPSSDKAWAPKWLQDLRGIDYFDDITEVYLFGDPDDTELPAIDEHLAALRGLPRVKKVSLSRARVSDAGCLHLATLPALETLGLDNTQVTDVGLASLARLARLESLTLRGCKITGEGFASLAGHANLSELYLDGTMVDDAGTSHLATTLNLQILDLSQTRITDECVEDLLRCRHLSFLNVRQTHLSSETIARLKRELPGCYVAP